MAYRRSPCDINPVKAILTSLSQAVPLGLTIRILVSGLLPPQTQPQPLSLRLLRHTVVFTIITV